MTLQLNNNFLPDSELDYHNRGVLDPYQIEVLLTTFIEDSYYSGQTFLLVITGKGKVVRPIVKKLLQENELVDSFRSAGYFNGQEGAFEVILVK